MDKIQFNYVKNDMNEDFNKIIETNELDAIVIYSGLGNMFMLINSFTRKGFDSNQFSQSIDPFYRESEIYLDILNCTNSMETDYKSLSIESVSYNGQVVIIPLYDDIEKIGFVVLLKKDVITTTIRDELAEIIQKHNLYLIKKILYAASRNSIETMIHMLNRQYELVSPFMKQHSYNVGIMAKKIGMMLDLDSRYCDDLYFAGVIHDTGKIEIPPDILNSETKLSKDEFELMKTHVSKGHDFLRNTLYFPKYKNILVWINEHHEKYDGTGYPNGISGEELSLGGKILKAADAIDAMMSKRSYNRQFSIIDVIEEFKKHKGKDFDPVIVDTVVSLLTSNIKYDEAMIQNTILSAQLFIRIDEERTISLKGEFNSMRGNLFKTYEEVPEYLDGSESITIAISVRNNILEFQCLGDFVNSYAYRINEMKVSKAVDSFSLIWELEGVIIKGEEKSMILVTQISGNYLLFKKEKNDFVLENDHVYTIAMKFGEEVILVKGQMDFFVEDSDSVLYKFNYIGVEDKVRDIIFRHLFRKQIELRKVMF